MRQLKVKSLNEQFYEYVDSVYECFDECPDRVDSLFRAYTLLSNALDISLSTVDVFVWGIKNNGGTYDRHDVAMKVNMSEWEVNRAVNELSRLSYMEIFWETIGSSESRQAMSSWKNLNGILRPLETVKKIINN